MMVKAENNKKRGVSIWFLYIGIFLCCSGIGVVVGAIFIAYWGIKTLEEAKQGNSYTENNTENNFTANINHYHAGNDGSDTGDWRSSAAANEDVPREFVSRDTLEENR